MMAVPTVNCMTIYFCCAFFAVTFGATIHREESSRLDKLTCSTLSDGARLGFHNEKGMHMGDKLVALGERIELRCQVVGAPQATIRWKHNGIFIDMEQTRDHQVLIENGDMPIIGMSTTVSKLTIDCVDNARTGHYTCVAENHCNEPIETSAIVALANPDGQEHFICPERSVLPGVAPEIVFWTDLLLERPEAAVTIFCRATGDPRPSIEWFETGGVHDNRKVENDEKHILLANGDLQIRGSKSKVENRAPFVSYKCVATNEHGTDSMETVIIYAKYY